MTTQPSDWAVARAFWHHREEFYRLYGMESGVSNIILDRARELDASSKCDCGCGRSVCPACGEDLGFSTPRAAEAGTTNSAQISSSLVVVDTERLDWIERTFRGMSNGERYLPLVMGWGKSRNGRTLREAIDKYMAKERK